MIPAVEKIYRLLRGAANRAILGLSMGGGETMLTGLHHPKLFGYIGSFSGGPNYRSELEKVEHAVLNKYRMIWLGCGTEDLNFPANKALVDWLDRDAHLWPVWHKFLAETAPQLFDRWTAKNGSESD